jgi:hypothetical protein
VAVALALALVACGSGDDDSTGATTSSTTSTTEAGATRGADLTALPLGDQNASSEPTKGSLYACNTDFDPNAPGAQAAGPWIDEEAGTWDATQKVTVRGTVDQGGEVRVAVADDHQEVSGNGLPTTPTGEFPVAADDPAAAYDANPNTIAGYDLDVQLPATPEVADQPTCVGGTVGVSVLGVPVFSAFDAGGRDAVAWEVQDACNGHPQQSGQYHFHSRSSCFTDEDGLFGYALDGFGIYTETDDDGRPLTTDDLDDCHGRTSEVQWRGERVEIYHYVATADFPYTVGCFAGTPIASATGLQLGPAPG